MKKFINLLNFEMNRFLNFLIPTLAIVVAMQLFQTIQSVLSYNKEAKIIMASGPGDVDSVLEELGTFSMQDVTAGAVFNLSIVLIILIFSFYSFFTWYREWLGKNTFIYRLLMLPISRFQIILSKSLVFLIGGLLTFSVQFGLFFIESTLIKQLITTQELFTELNLHAVKPAYDFFLFKLFPLEGIEFISVYSFAFAALITLFTAILLERSFGLKGLIPGVICFIGYFIVYSILTGLSYYDFTSMILKPSQVYIGLLLYQFLVIGLGLVISRFLLTHKIKV